MIGAVLSHFLDSGAFSLAPLAKKWAKKHRKREWAFYDSRDFWNYVEAYVAFVKKYNYAIDLYANIDVIYNPELTWRNQQILENDYGLKPVPLIHCGCGVKWLKHYMDLGYPLIGLGGLISTAGIWWMDEIFHAVCDQPSRLPKTKIHGFGISSYKLLLRYPWYSVDSSAWDKAASYGEIYVPHKRRGEYIFTTSPYRIKVTGDNPGATNGDNRHLFNMAKGRRELVEEWLESIGVKCDGEDGVCNDHRARRKANVLFFDRMQRELPPYPQPFTVTRIRGFAI